MNNVNTFLDTAAAAAKAATCRHSLFAFFRIYFDKIYHSFVCCTKSCEMKNSKHNAWNCERKKEREKK